MISNLSALLPSLSLSSMTISIDQTIPLFSISLSLSLSSTFHNYLCPIIALLLSATSLSLSTQLLSYFPLFSPSIIGETDTY